MYKKIMSVGGSIYEWGNKVGSGAEILSKEALDKLVASNKNIRNVAGNRQVS